MQIDIRADVAAAEKQLFNYERRVIPKAIKSALRKTSKNVHTQAVRSINKKTKIAQKKIKSHVKIKLGGYGQFWAEVIAHKKTFNLIEFVTAGKRHPGAFRKLPGVTARSWGTSTLHRGAFIIRARNSGKAIVVKRRANARRRGNTWGGRWSETVYGPGVHLEFQRPAMMRLLRIVARKRFSINFERDLNFFVARVNR